MVQIILAENSQHQMTRIKTENFRIIIHVYLLDNLRLHFPKWITAIYKLEWKHCLGFRSIYGTLECSFDIWDVTHEWIGIRMFCVRLTVDCWLPALLLMSPCLCILYIGSQVPVSLCPRPHRSCLQCLIHQPIIRAQASAAAAGICKICTVMQNCSQWTSCSAKICRDFSPVYFTWKSNRLNFTNPTFKCSIAHAHDLEILGSQWNITLHGTNNTRDGDKKCLGSEEL